MRRTTIEKDTPILPHVIADAVISELSRYLGQEIHERETIAAYLADKADLVYRHNDRFAAKIRGSGNKGRDYLYAFMRHWLSAEMHEVAPLLYLRIPDSFKIGGEIRA